MLFKEVIAVYSENHTKDINAKYRVAGVEAVGACYYHWPLKG
jgi:hypothetical protein